MSFAVLIEKTGPLVQRDDARRFEVMQKGQWTKDDGLREYPNQAINVYYLLRVKEKYQSVLCI